MKKNIYYMLFCIATIGLHAQCNQTAFGFGNNTTTTMYNVEGMVEVVLNTNNTVTLNTGANFATASGPDVRVFLVDRGSLTNTQLKNTAMFLARPKIEMGMLPSGGSTVTGSRSFTKAIPTGMNISNFNTVYFYCQQFNQFWDYGSFTAFNTSNCSVLSTSEFKSADFTLYPNPVKDEFTINISNDAAQLKSIQIYNNLGQIVFTKSENFDNRVSIANFSKGMYAVEIKDSEGRQLVKNIIKE